ncbi:GreA/GreB family elongation factor [Atopomonas sediminilitoris]|uniref:GreA/GreB family elongation factor n=1 Tax=Atopomonas sediminilitoris TaxID=2919919 RepID=UPI001F4E1C74|nr:GreA/GreB family elongation factor [Atopomonas sediminilitoris]MCJ8169665.1 GreA/GreB family elongation factor [Atopomonas sediminilitoris]
MDKPLLRECVLAQLEADLAVAVQAAKTAHETATAEENIAENKYDTLGLEAAYLAAGQSRRVQEITQALQRLQQLTWRDYDPELGVDLGVVVQLQGALQQGQNPSRWLLLLPDAAGLKITFAERQIMLVSPQSPMGQALRGRLIGDEVALATAAPLQRLQLRQAY